MKRSRFSKEQIISILREGDLVEDRPALQPALGDTQHQAMDHGVSVLDPASQRRLHPFQRRFGRAVARGFPLVGPTLHGHVARRLDLVQRPFDRLGVLADGRAYGLEGRVALAGFVISMGEREVERHA